MNLATKIEAHSKLLMVACTELRIETDRLYELAKENARGARRVTNYSDLQAITANVARLGVQLDLLVQMEYYNLADAIEDDPEPVANCGCVYHAEEGIPCPHDIALKHNNIRRIYP